jgi:hypothetical protein
MTTASRISGPSLKTLREEARHCRACHLWKNATQTVFGEGPQNAQMMLVGEQPGDKEDLAGKPFVGPAGLMLEGLCHQCRKTFQIRTARKNPSASEAEYDGDQGVPAMVRARTGRDQASAGAGDGRQRCPMRARKNNADQQKSRTPDRSR